MSIDEVRLTIARDAVYYGFQWSMDLEEGKWARWTDVRGKSVLAFVGNGPLMYPPNGPSKPVKYMSELPTALAVLSRDYLVEAKPLLIDQQHLKQMIIDTVPVSEGWQVLGPDDEIQDGDRYWDFNTSFPTPDRWGYSFGSVGGYVREVADPYMVAVRPPKLGEDEFVATLPDRYRILLADEKIQLGDRWWGPSVVPYRHGDSWGRLVGSDHIGKSVRTITSIRWVGLVFRPGN